MAAWAGAPEQTADPFYALVPDRRTNLGALPAVSELRGFMISPRDGTLLIANGFKDLSQVLQFSPSSTPGSFEFGGIYASKGLHHPFDLVFALGNNLYVSNQDARAKTSNSPVIMWYASAGASGQVFPAKQTFQTLRGLATDGSCLYVADAGTKQDGMFYGRSLSSLVRRFVFEFSERRPPSRRPVC